MIIFSSSITGNLILRLSVYGILFLSFILIHPALLRAGVVDPSFRSALSVKGRVNSVVKQPDGKIIIGGEFSFVNSLPQKNISRLNSDGSVDSTFLIGTGANDFIYSLAIQPDGKILVGGKFTRFNGKVRKSLVRLLSDGSLDESFNSVLQGGTVEAIALQSDGKILAGGFNVRITRFNSDGSIDSTFNPVSNVSSGNIYTISIQNDGKIIVGGTFSQLVNGSPRDLARLNPDGSLDPSFNHNLVGAISSSIIQPNGKIIIAGSFGIIGVPSERYIVRLNENGSVDTTFSTVNHGFNNIVRSILLQADGKIVVGGFFTSLNNSFYNGIARLNSNGTIDTTFTPGNGFDGNVNALVEVDSGIVAVGNFSSANSLPRFSIARLNNNGAVDSGFKPGAGFPTDISVIKTLPSGKILIGGDFDMVNGQARSKLARINQDGTLDESFAAGTSFNGRVRCIEIQPDGKLLVGGFYQVNGAPRYLARLNADGTLDSSFNPVISSENSLEIYQVKVQNDGKIVIGGAFERVGGVSRRHLARLNQDGSLDATFNTGSGFDYPLLGFVVQPDGKIVAFGIFTTFNGVARRYIARINSNGTLDESFNITPNENVWDIAIQADGKILIGGNFSSINNVSRNSIARVNPDGTLDAGFTSPFIQGGSAVKILIRPNGKIVVGGIALRLGAMGIIKYVVQLNENGSINNSISPNIGGSVYALENYSNEQILVGGRLAAPKDSIENDNYALSLAKVANKAQVSDFDYDGKSDISVFRPSTGSWYISRSSDNSFSGVGFGQQGDLIAPADFDGDGRTDISVFRQGFWYRINSSTNQFVGLQFGVSEDIPVPADYDADGKADIAVFRPSNSTWYRINSSNNEFVAFKWGASGDKPQTGDFDGDGKSDYAVFRPLTGSWYILRSSDNSFYGINFGISEDIPTPADYDGDGKTDISVFRPSAGSWYRINSTNNQFFGQQFGIPEDKPVQADYDGDGKADIAVFRPSAGAWYIQRSTSGFFAQQFGTNTDIPTP